MTRKKRVSREIYDLEQETAAANAAARAIEYIEAHLFDDLTAARIARSCHQSTFHFSRAFSRRKGESVMSYVRGRRLEIAAARLRSEPKTSVVEVALDCRFDSPAAFTRAFTRAFGVSPSAYRSAAQPRVRHWRITIMQPTLVESIQRVETIHIAGLAGRYEPSTFIRINELWRAFAEKKEFAGRMGGGETCGVFRHRDFTTQTFEHLAGARVAAGMQPEGLEVWTLPAREYLVFKQHLTDGDLHPQVAAAQAEIWTKRLPMSGRTLAHAPDFQIYPAHFKVGPGGWLQYYIPIE